VTRASLTDEELIYAVARGDSVALAELYARQGPRLLTLARRILKGDRDAEDLLHDLFVEVWRFAGDFDPSRGTVRAWLLLRLRCRGIDRLRTLKSQHSFGRAEHDEDTPVSAPQPRLADWSRACSALDQLHPEKRQVVELGYFAGLSAQQIADQLGIPVGTVKSRTAAAIAELRQKLGTIGAREVGS
jgi:RNA polymerase sigma-70 factor (ECF subfamily)